MLRDAVKTQSALVGIELAVPNVCPDLPPSSFKSANLKAPRSMGHRVAPLSVLCCEDRMCSMEFELRLLEEDCREILWAHLP